MKHFCEMVFERERVGIQKEKEVETYFYISKGKKEKIAFEISEI